MKIYVAHSMKYDYKEELYKPLRNSDLNNEIEIILPHENSEQVFNSREELNKVDYMLAEVSIPSVGVGIEIGWADSRNIPIILLHKSEIKISDAVKSVATHIVEYSSGQDLIDKIKNLF